MSLFYVIKTHDKEPHWLTEESHTLDDFTDLSGMKIVMLLDSYGWKNWAYYLSPLFF